MMKKFMQWYRRMLKTTQKNMKVWWSQVMPLFRMTTVAIVLGLLVVGGLAYWYVVPMLQKTSAEEDFDDEYGDRRAAGLETRLTATEMKLKKLEKKVAQVEREFDEDVDALEKKVAQSEAKLATVGTLEEKVATIEKQETQEVKRLAAVNQIIRQEVSGQMDSLRHEVQENEQKKNRKKIFQRFLDQLAADDDD